MAEKFRQKNPRGNSHRETYQSNAKMTWKAFRIEYKDRVLSAMPTSSQEQVKAALDHFERIAKPREDGEHQGVYDRRIRCQATFGAREAPRFYALAGNRQQGSAAYQGSASVCLRLGIPSTGAPNPDAPVFHRRSLAMSRPNTSRCYITMPPRSFGYR